MNTQEIKEARLHKKRLARFRFRSLIRKVIVNQAWLSDVEETTLGDNVRKNVAIIVRRKGAKGILTLHEKVLLNTPIQYRTEEECRAIALIAASLKCFENYQPKVRGRLARVVFYQFFRKGRTIVREGHFANAMYFILDGEITVTKRIFNQVNNEWTEEVISVLGPGEVFGELSLMRGHKRSATCITAFDTELLCVYKDDFIAILKEPLSLQWENIKLSLRRFEYFENWSLDQIQDCCIRSKIQQYNPLQTVYAEDKGRAGFVIFVLSGECLILQCLRLNKTRKNGVDNYSLNPIKPIKKTASAKSIENPKTKEYLMKLNRIIEPKNISATKLITSVTELSLAKSPNKRHIQICSSEKLSKDENEFVQFVEVGSYSSGSVFGLGEEMIDRTIVAKNSVQCLLIPRYWLFKKSQNIGNFWQRTKMYLNVSLPSRQDVFEDYVKNAKWNDYKRKVIKEVYAQRQFRTTTTLEDVPIICRIENGF